MNLAGGFPFGFNPEEESKRAVLNKKFPTAQCPHCRTPQQGTQVLIGDYKAQNLDCMSCKKGFCSFCNKGKHYLGECREAVEAKRNSMTQRR
ncbi:unnamed protein product [Blepharisma stoltei]|uniref:IBR domain-containing protein n=1 Tax=Blepharisma stoltei TaxID=1481888 RepID=A0AAU9KD79_9CILI|nr:unnamed protein product [Blepharisma stoltei]